MKLYAILRALSMGLDHKSKIDEQEEKCHERHDREEQLYESIVAVQTPSKGPINEGEKGQDVVNIEQIEHDRTPLEEGTFGLGEASGRGTIKTCLGLLFCEHHCCLNLAIEGMVGGHTDAIFVVIVAHEVRVVLDREQVLDFFTETNPTVGIGTIAIFASIDGDRALGVTRTSATIYRLIISLGYGIPAGLKHELVLRGLDAVIEKLESHGRHSVGIGRPSNKPNLF
jgi:hypothetical protein